EPASLVAGSGVAPAATGALPRAERGRRGGGPPRGAGQQRRGEPQQPPARLLLLAARAGAGPPVAVTVLPQSSTFSTQRPFGAEGQKSRRAADGPAAAALAGNARLPTLPAELTRSATGAAATRPQQAGPDRVRRVT